MSANGMAYHTVVHALEAAPGWTSQRRFASAVAHSINGHLPYQRYHAAGRARRKANAREGVVERLVNDWLLVDLNPAVQLVRSVNRPALAVSLYNAYNASANLAVRTNAAIFSSPSGEPSAVIAKRVLLSSQIDPELCRIGTISILNAIMEIVARNEHERLVPKIYCLSDIAIHLGVERSAGAEVAHVFEAEGYIPVGEVARRIGCHQRTLERWLREEGLTAEAIRMSTRLIRATKRLRNSESLTAIALEEGFSDQAQMTRAFRSSCGMTPSTLRAAA